MKRQITREETTALIKNIREILPEITIRTTMLVGYPNETDNDFKALCDFVEEMQFERLGVFTYSHEEDTPAFDLEDNISDDVKSLRAAQLMEVQQNISLAKNEALVGKTLKVIIDRKEGEYFIARTEYDSPEVDNEVLISAKNQYARIGDFATVTIHDATDFDLYGTITA